MPVKHCESAVVVENKPLGNGIFKMIVWWPYPADAGQFFMVRGWDKFPLLSRPISVHDADGERVTFLYEVRGEGTRLLSEKKTGESVELSGPVGNGFPVEKIKGKVAVVSGGIGIAPLLLAVKSLSGCPSAADSGIKATRWILSGRMSRRSVWRLTAVKRDTRALLPICLTLRTLIWSSPAGRRS